MKVRHRSSWLAAALATALVAAAAAAQEPVVLARSMLEVLAPRTNEVVGVLIDNLGPDGAVDPAALSDQEWSAMAEAVAVLEDETTALLRRPIRVVAAPGDKIFGEETSGLSAADVQAMIDAGRADFDFLTGVFLADVVRMREAIAARDPDALWAVADRIDLKCEACHEQFWYPSWEETAQPPP
jgi:hypothetical protein